MQNMMNRLALQIVAIVVAVPIAVLLMIVPACAQVVSPEQAATLKADVAALNAEIKVTETENAKYGGGLVKTLIEARLAILRQTHAMLDQRAKASTFGIALRYTVDGKPFVLSSTAKDELAAVEREITDLDARIAAQQAEADRYAGGLVQALAISTVTTSRQTRAMLDQRRLALKYGLPQYLGFASTTQPSVTTPAAGQPAALTPAPASVSSTTDQGAPKETPADCLKIQTYDSSVLSTNNVYTELAWKIDVANSCATPFSVRAVFKIFDKDDFELDSDSQDVYVPPNGTGNARGKMLVSPPEKARRMTKQGASLSLR